MKLPFSINRNGYQYRAYTFLFGMAEILGGIIKILTLGFIIPQFTIYISRKQAALQIRRAIKERTGK